MRFWFCFFHKVYGFCSLVFQCNFGVCNFAISINGLQQPLKRKGDAADHKAEFHEWATGAGYVETVHSPLHTPASGKSAKTNKTSRVAKGNRLGPQTPISNAGKLGFYFFLFSFLI